MPEILHTEIHVNSQFHLQPEGFPERMDSLTTQLVRYGIQDTVCPKSRELDPIGALSLEVGPRNIPAARWSWNFHSMSLWVFYCLIISVILRERTRSAIIVVLRIKMSNTPGLVPTSVSVIAWIKEWFYELNNESWVELSELPIYETICRSTDAVRIWSQLYLVSPLTSSPARKKPFPNERKIFERHSDNDTFDGRE